MCAQQQCGWARDLRDEASGQGLTFHQIAAAIHAEAERRGERLSWLAAHRVSRGWTQAEAADALASLFRSLGKASGGITAGLISRWERGAQRPAGEHLDGLCRLFRANADALGFPQPDYTERAGAERAEAEPERVRPDRPSRRGLLRGLTIGGLASGVLTGSIASALAEARGQVDASLETSQVADSTVDHWEEVVRGYGRAYGRSAPLETLTTVVQDLTAVRELRDRPQPLGQKQRLTRVIAQLSGLVGVLALDLGDYQESRRWFHTARLAAEDVGDRALRAWVQARAALVPLYEGNLTESADMASAAETLAGSSPSPASVLGPMTQARALAQHGNADEACQAVERAQRNIDRLSAEATDEILYGYTPRQLHFHSAQVWTYVARPEDAQQAQAKATALYAPDEYLDPALMGFDEAIRLIRGGDAVAGAEHAAAILAGLTARQRTAIIEIRARAVLRALPAGVRRIPAVTAYRDVLALGSGG